MHLKLSQAVESNDDVVKYSLQFFSKHNTSKLYHSGSRNGSFRLVFSFSERPRKIRFSCQRKARVKLEFLWWNITQNSVRNTRKRNSFCFRRQSPPLFQTATPGACGMGHAPWDLNSQILATVAQSFQGLCVLRSQAERFWGGESERERANLSFMCGKTRTETQGIRFCFP